MEIRGLPDETERVNLIAYLRTLSDNHRPCHSSSCGLRDTPVKCALYAQ